MPLARRIHALFISSSRAPAPAYPYIPQHDDDRGTQHLDIGIDDLYQHYDRPVLVAYITDSCFVRYQSVFMYALLNSLRAVRTDAASR